MKGLAWRVVLGGVLACGVAGRVQADEPGRAIVEIAAAPGTGIVVDRAGFYLWPNASLTLGARAGADAALVADAEWTDSGFGQFVLVGALYRIDLGRVWVQGGLRFPVLAFRGAWPMPTAAVGLELIASGRMGVVLELRASPILFRAEASHSDDFMAFFGAQIGVSVRP